MVQNNEDKYSIMHNTLSSHIYNPGLLARNKLFGSMKYPALGSSTARFQVAYEQGARQQNHGYKPKDMVCDRDLYDTHWALASCSLLILFVR